jgi:porphobilinogen synthase
VTTAQTATTLKLTQRLRRLRRSETLRAMVRETRLSPDMFILPLFVCDGEGVRREVPSMPGVFNLSGGRGRQRSGGGEGRRRVRACCSSASPIRKTASVQPPTIPRRRCRRPFRAIKREVPGVLVVTDVCLCEYTDHGHCGILLDDTIANDPTVELLVRTPVSHAAAGADIVAPSDMMDGRVGAIRTTLDERGFEQTAIMAYAAKYCSAFYGPFRDAAASAPQFGDRRSHQMDPANAAKRCARWNRTSRKAPTS